MTFRRQVRWALTRGGAAVVAGGGLALAAVLLEAGGYAGASRAAAVASVGLIAGGALLVLGGAVARPAQRAAFRGGLPAGRLRDWGQRHALLRWWYWVDETGRDRDG